MLQNFVAVKLLGVNSPLSSLKIRLKIQFRINFIQKFAAGKVNQPVIQGVKTQIQNLFVKNLKQEAKLRGQKVCRRILCYVCMCKYFSYEKGCFLRTIISQAILVLFFVFFRIMFCAQRDYWNKMKSLIITNQKMRVFQQSR